MNTSKKRRMESPLRVSCAQMEPNVGDVPGNIEKSVRRIEFAVEQEGAQLLVLPELTNSGYVFKSRDEAFESAEVVGEGPASKAWLELCRKYRIWVVAGIAERDGDNLYNSAVLMGPHGHVGTFRKIHLWEEENLFFEPGNLGFPVWQTPFGRIAAHICYDSWFPESFRLVALQGADIVCVPTNWVPIPGQDPEREAMANILCMAAAHSNSIYVAAADRIGTERGQRFIGQSVIVSYTGWPIAGPATAGEVETLVAEINLSDARRNRNWNAFNQPLRDRRCDVYSEMLGTGYRRGWY